MSSRPPVSHRYSVPLLVLMMAMPAAGEIYHVNPDAFNHVDGQPCGSIDTTWDSAFQYPNNALACAGSGDEVWLIGSSEFGGQVYVADMPGDTNSSDAHFFLPDGVKLYGGFAGGEDSPDDRSDDSELYLSVLDGYLGLDQGIPIRSKHVCVANETDGYTYLDRVVIQGGGHTADSSGGGLFKIGGGTLEMVDCVVRRNIGTDQGGGGVYASAFWTGSTLHGLTLDIRRTEFVENDCKEGCGGGMQVRGEASGTFLNSQFIDNYGSHGGGGLCLVGAIDNLHDETLDRIDLKGCLFDGNTDGNRGSGGIHHGLWGRLYVTNCTIVNNSARYFTHGNSSPVCSNWRG